jgi:uncharacterized damage-inducible protein DinB
MMLAHLRRMARYNRWANGRLYAACGQLPAEEYHKPRPAFFGSIHGTLNHLLVGDRIWLARIEGRPNPNLRLDDQPCATLEALAAERAAEDERMIGLVDGYRDDAAVARPVRYRMITQPDEMEMALHLCWLNLFNHETHHRGQVHDQLSQTEVAPPPLDLVFYLREIGEQP